MALTTLDYFFDPGCPWTWMTSRWVVDVAARKSVPVRWRAFSLAIKNRGREIPEQFRPLMAVSLGALRVVEAVWAKEGDEPIGRLYTELGRRFHQDNDMTTAAVEAALGACGLDPTLISAADDQRWDREIEASMAEATELVGTDVGVPVMVFHEASGIHAISGPVMSPTVTGDEALALWDHVIGISRCPTFFELKRSRTAPPHLGPPAT
ncbi:MAG: disulfide bond formation protein DsbA [Actinomycetota bacterium]|nr:disulfide bond formation protein DsbA [Actinomycetota bacterium]